MNEALLQNISVRPLAAGEPVPYELLLDADPSMEAIAKYLPFSEVFIALYAGKVVACFVLYPVDADTLEIKNIAVEESCQGKGIGKLLLREATEIAIKKGMQNIIIGTANSSVGQLYLYQKEGFEISDIRYGFFLQNYPEPFFENGIQCKHMLVLSKKLS